MTAFTLTGLIVLIITITEGINSIFFFLFYFLAFALAFALNAEAAFILCFCVLLFFFPSTESNQTIANLIKLASLLLLAPFAYFLGKEKETKYLRALQQAEGKQTIDAATTTIKQDVATVIKSEAKSLKEIDLTVLKDIVTQTDRVREKNEEIIK